MDISSFELLEKKIHQTLDVLSKQKGTTGNDNLAISRSQVERITEKLAQISEWIDHAEV